MSEGTKDLDQLAGMITDLVCSDNAVYAYCEPIARKLSQTEGWGQEQWEQNENTAKYDLYYATLSNLHTKILARAITNMTNLT